MSGLNYFGLLRKEMSTERLASISDLTANEIKHAETTGELLPNDHKKFKSIWERHNKLKKIRRTMRGFV